MKEKSFIGNFGLFSSVVVTMVGIGIFSYPAELARHVGTDGWFVALLSGLIVSAIALAMYKTVKLNNYRNFSSILENNFGNFFGKTIALLFCIYGVIFMAVGLRVFSEVIKMYLLERTPTEFILLVMILTATYIARGDLESLIRYNIISFWIMFVPIFFVLIFSAVKADFTNIFPVLTKQPMEYINALSVGTYSFAGFQVLYLLLPFAKNVENSTKIIFKSIAFVTFFYIMIIIFSLAIFSEAHTQDLLWPGIAMVRVTEIKGAFVERWEGIIMAAWVIFSFTTIANMYYLSSDILRNTLKLKEIKLSSFLIVPFLYIFALYPENLSELYQITNQVLTIVSIFMLILLPLVLVLISYIRQGGKENNEA